MIPLLQNKVQVHEHGPSQVQVHEHCPPWQSQPPLYPSVSRTQHILVYSLHPPPSQSKPRAPNDEPSLTLSPPHSVLSISATAHLCSVIFLLKNLPRGFHWVNPRFLNKADWSASSVPGPGLHSWLWLLQVLCPWDPLQDPPPGPLWTCFTHSPPSQLLREIWGCDLYPQVSLLHARILGWWGCHGEWWQHSPCFTEAWDSTRCR